MRIGINQFCFPASCDVRQALERAKALGFECMEICLTTDRQEGLSAGGVTDALGISGYHNRLLHEHAGEQEFRQLRAMAQEIGISLSSVGGIISFSIYPLTAPDGEMCIRDRPTPWPCGSSATARPPWPWPRGPWTVAIR